MVRISQQNLEDICAKIFMALGVPETEAIDSAGILIAADARGIRSHGMARIKRFADGLKSGQMSGGIKPEVLHETPISLVLDAKGGMGLPLSKNAMRKVMDKARESGVGVCSIRDSNHFGIAGVYSEMAAREDMIGIAMTNTAALGVPTFAREAAFGTNPIAFAAPALDGKIFSLDMSTTTVTRGIVEVYEKDGKEIPAGWAVGKDGLTTTDPVSLLEDMLHLRGGGLLPLGGETGAGYKGYGLGVMVDILCAIASGGTFGRAVRDTLVSSARVCHFFMALRLDIFRPAEEFKKDMTAMLNDLNSLKPIEGKERVLYAGQIEQEIIAENQKNGIPLVDSTWDDISSIAKELGIPVSDNIILSRN